MLSPSLLKVLIAMCIISALASTAGTLSVLRKNTFFVSGTAHAALAGAALGVYLDECVFPTSSYLFAYLFAVGVALVVSLLEARGVPSETAVGVVFGVSMSIAVLLLSLLRDSAARAWGLIIGDPYLLTWGDVGFMAAVAFAVAIFALLFFRRFVLVCFDPEGAASYGLRVWAHTSAMYVLIAVAVVVLLQGVGLILVYALLVIPPATGARVGTDAQSMVMVTLLVSLGAGLLGTLISYPTSLPVSAVSGLLLAGVYAISLIARRGS